MKKFIAYFDYLGFKEFIENNDLESQRKVMDDNFIQMERALAQGSYREGRYGTINDISKCNINCINFSDTVIFFTNNKTEESFKEIIKVAYRFNFNSVSYCFPVRGSIVFGELVHIPPVNIKNECGSFYNINSVYGKGLVKACELANCQNWAGTVLDESLISECITRNYNLDFLNKYAKRYTVPYKNSCLDKEKPEEFVLHLNDGALNEQDFMSVEKSIKDNFAFYNKPVDSLDVQEKIHNTIRFLGSYK